MIVLAKKLISDEEIHPLMAQNADQQTMNFVDMCAHAEKAANTVANFLIKVVQNQEKTVS